MKFHLILTLDYEMFGNGSGCIEHCLLSPTRRLLELMRKYDAGCTFFVDALEFEAMMGTEGYLGSDRRSALEEQLSEIGRPPHEIQLHLHPQWFDATWDGSEWRLRLDLWRIGDLPRARVDELVARGRQFLSGYATKEVSVFRAGGWAMQPSGHVLQSLAGHGIAIDSTVAPGAVNRAGGDWYDFTRWPGTPFWRVSEDICSESSGASILEVPITTGRIGPHSHARVLMEQRGQPEFPENCVGSYAGPNGWLQSMAGKLGKLARLGHVMLDYSRMPSWTLIEVTRDWMRRFAHTTGPVPIVAIGHNKNFSSWSAENLATWLDWIEQEADVETSSYGNFARTERLGSVASGL